MLPDFVLSTEDVNRYGYRVLTAGIDLTSFMANPVMYYNHNTESFPVGHWENIRVEGGKLIATPVFDADEKSQAVRAKVESGTLRAASINFDEVSESTDPADVLPGQRYATVKTCVLVEASIVGIPGNKNALRLKNKKGLSLSLDGDTSEEELSKILKPIKSLSSMNKVFVELSLAMDSTEDAAVEAIRQLKAVGTKSLMAMAEAKGMVTDENRESYQLFANTQPEAFGKLIAAHKVVDAPKGGELSAAIEEANRRAAEQNRQLGGGANQDKNAWEIMLDATGGDVAKIEAFKKEKPEQYKLAFKAKYGLSYEG